MKKQIVISTLIMFFGHTIWNALNVIYFIYFYPELEKRFVIGGFYLLFPGLILCTLFILLQIKIEKVYSSRRNLIICASLIVSTIITCTDSYIATLIYSYIDCGVMKYSFGQFITLVANWLLFYFSSSVLFYFIYFHRKSVEQELQLTLTKALANEARLMMLRYQINPHFLFNTLNTIQSVIQTDQERAKRMIGDLSEFFRYTLSKNDQVFVTIEEEMSAVANYLSIQEERFGDSLAIQYDIDKGINQIKIPFFIIHPLVENAVKYGFSSGNEVLKLIIKVKRIVNGVKISIINSGSLKPVIPSDLHDQISTKTGIANLKKRLELLYPDLHEFALFEEEGYVNAIVVLKDKGEEN